MGQVSTRLNDSNTPLGLFLIAIQCVLKRRFRDYRGSPNIEMDEFTFMVNRERAIDYLNTCPKVSYFPATDNISRMLSVVIGSTMFKPLLTIDSSRRAPGLCARHASWLGPQAPDQSAHCLCTCVPRPLHAQHVSDTHCGSCIQNILMELHTNHSSTLR